MTEFNIALRDLDEWQDVIRLDTKERWQKLQAMAGVEVQEVDVHECFLDRVANEKKIRPFVLDFVKPLKVKEGVEA